MAPAIRRPPCWIKTEACSQSAIFSETPANPATGLLSSASLAAAFPSCMRFAPDRIVRLLRNRSCEQARFQRVKRAWLNPRRSAHFPGDRDAGSTFTPLIFPPVNANAKFMRVQQRRRTHPCFGLHGIARGWLRAVEGHAHVVELPRQRQRVVDVRASGANGGGDEFQRRFHFRAIS